MSIKRMLIQTQLSNYDTKGKFILECDSGWQMTMGRVREMLKLVPDLHIDVMGPLQDTLITHPSDINPDLWENYGDDGDQRLKYIEHRILPNALVTRYDFDWAHIAIELNLGMQKIGRAHKYDIVYLNDPMHLRNFMAMFHVIGGYKPKFVVHSHFIDNPSCPKFPTEASLWMGQVEAARKADVNFWQCESAMNIFFDEMGKEYQPHVVTEVKAKSMPWDDGYSSEEITTPVVKENLRFDVSKFEEVTRGKVVIFVPNRIGGRGRSSDYTNCGKFMFDILPGLRAQRKDFVVFAGNPSQKFFNHELEKECGPNGYVSLVPDAFNRDEFKYIASKSHLALGLYDQDSYGGTVARECIELGCLPVWPHLYEYASIADLAEYPFTCAGDFSDLVVKMSQAMDTIKRFAASSYEEKLQRVVRSRCSYEETTDAALRAMGLIG